MKEDDKTAGEYDRRVPFTFPMLMDRDGAVALAWAPPEAAPDLERDTVAIASNIIVDREGRIAFWSLLDSRNFDAKLVDLKAKLEEMLATR